MDSNTSPGLNTGIMNSFTTVMESIVNARLRDTFATRDVNMKSEQQTTYFNSFTIDKTAPQQERSPGKQNASSRLHMGIIGCLPDNVQKQISDLRNEQFKEEETFPHTTTLFATTFHRLSLTVGVFTLYELNSMEGILRHFDSTIRMMIHSKTPITLWKHPICVINTGYDLKDAILTSMAETILDIQHENIQHSFPGKSRQELHLYLKETLISPRFRSYEDHFHHSLMRLSESTSSSTYRHLVGILDRITDPDCTVSDFHKVKNYLKSSTLLVKTFWKIWGHDQIASKIFPVAKTEQGACQFQSWSRGGMMDRVVSVAQVSLKEGLKKIIDSLKHQETNDHRCRDMRADSESCSCCGNCDQTVSSQTLLFPSNEGDQHDRSAFHRPERIKRYHQSTTPYSDALKAVAVSPYRLDSRSSVFTSNRKTQMSDRVRSYSTSTSPLHALYCDFFGTKYERTNHLEPSSTNSL